MKKLFRILALAVLIAATFIAGRHSRPQTNVIFRGVDTLVVRDTIRDTLLIPRTVTLVRIDTVFLRPVALSTPSTTLLVPGTLARAPLSASLGIPGTLTPEIPIEQKKPAAPPKNLFADSNLAANLVAVEVPIERKVYQTDDYRAEIEGFRASLVSMEVFRKTQIVTERVEIRTPDRRRWGIGIQAGYGATLRDNRLTATPYLGVGLSYNLFTW